METKKLLVEASYRVFGKSIPRSQEAWSETITFEAAYLLDGDLSGS